MSLRNQFLEFGLEHPGDFQGILRYCGGESDALTPVGRVFLNDNVPALLIPGIQMEKILGILVAFRALQNLLENQLRRW